MSPELKAALDRARALEAGQRANVQAADEGAAEARGIIEKMRAAEDLKGVLREDPATVDYYQSEIDAGRASEVLPNLREYDARQSLNSFVRTGLPQGATLGAADEIQAFATGEDVEAIRARNQAREALSPSGAMAGEMTGGVLATAPLMGAAMRATAASPLLTQMAATGGVGGASGAALGFNKGEGGYARRIGSISPAQVGAGAIAGAAVPPIGRMIGGAAGMGRGASAVSGMGFSPRASRRAVRAVSADAAWRDDVVDYLRNLGRESMVADAGINTQQEAARLVAREGGEGAARLARAIEDRSQQGAIDSRMGETLDTAMGRPQNMVQQQAELRARRRAAAGENYDPLKQEIIPIDSELRDILKRARASGAFTDINRIARAEGVKIPDIRNPSVVGISGEAMDIISRGIRDSADAAFARGRGSLGSALGSINERLIERTPGLRAARRQYREDSAVIEASERGADIFSPRVSVDQFAADWAKMSEEARQAFRIAARGEIENKVAGAVHAGRQGLNAMGPRASLEKVRIAFGDDAVNEIQRRLAAEPVFADTRNRVTQGSRTAANLAAANDAPLMDLTTGRRAGPIQRARQATGDVGNVIVDALLRRNGAQDVSDMARLLSSQGDERDIIIRAIMQDASRINRSDRRRALAESLTRRLGSGAIAPALFASE